MICPRCGPEDVVGNGLRKNGKQNYLCNSCARQSVGNPALHYRISEEKRSLTDRLLSEKIPPAGTARSAQVSERRLQCYVNDIYDNIPKKLTVLPEKKGVSPSSAAGCGRLQGTERINIGSGRLSTEIHAGLSVFMSAAGIATERRNCGGACPLFIGNALFVLQIFGRRIKQ